ncbi:MAG: hypothetical protein C0601_02085 [Candidatus Muiribacterium halophilum]|uniref:Uncharacterized protein n=1 Tax=Muiribacterium halophilum TaxID=2053465 RepID=A0A2N5ZL34_MUIH1|nr:MAG: hypothetical protein C0601_02085 [Candidatus Muirbacterium halophilum]
MILLVNPPVSSFAPFQNKSTYGLASLAKFLGKKFLEVAIIDDADISITIKKILEFKDKVRLIGFTGMSYQMNSAMLIAKKIKKELSDIPIVFGGPAATGLYDKLVRENYIDYVIRGEGELALSSLYRIIEINGNFGTVPSLSYFDGKIVKNNSMSQSLPASEIPLPERADMPGNGIIYDHALKADAALVIFSRGCFGRCSFCMAHNIFPGKVRFVSADRAVEYIKKIQADYNINNFIIDDDNFLYNKDFILKFCKLVKDLNIKFRINMSGSSFSKDLILKLKEVGLVKISVGVETIDPNVQKLIYKGVNMESILELTDFCRKNDILVALLFMAGLPGETKESFINNLRFISNSKPNGGFDFQLFQPHPGTFSDIKLEDYGKILTKDLDFYFSDNIVYLPKDYKDTQELVKLIEKFLKKAVTTSDVQEISLLQKYIDKKSTIIIDPSDFTGDFDNILTHWRGSERCRSGLSIIKGQNQGRLEYNFNIEKIESKKYLLAFRGASHPEGFPQGDEYSSDVSIKINDRLLWTGKFRSIHTIGHLFKFKFPAVFLKEGQNTITFEIPDESEYKNGISIFAYALNLYFRKYETGILLIPV